MSNGEGAHYSHLEIGRKTMNSLTRVAKDTLVIEVYEHEDIEPTERQDKLALRPELVSRRGVIRSLKANGGSGNIPKVIIIREKAK